MKHGGGDDGLKYSVSDEVTTPLQNEKGVLSCTCPDPNMGRVAT